MLYIGLIARAPTTITAATHCCTSNFFALIVCSQIPSINGQITNRYNQLTANSWRGRCLKAKIWQNLFLKAFEVILCQKVVFQNSGKLQYTGIFAADGAMPLYWSSTVLYPRSVEEFRDSFLLFVIVHRILAVVTYNLGVNWFG